MSYGCWTNLSLFCLTSAGYLPYNKHLGNQAEQERDRLAQLYCDEWGTFNHYAKSQYITFCCCWELCGEQYAVYSLPFILCSVYCLVSSMQFAVRNVQCTVCCLQCAVCSVKCAVYSKYVKCTVYSLHCTVTVYGI